MKLNPNDPVQCQGVHKGITIRQEFAKVAMQGLISDPNAFEWTSDGDENIDLISSAAVKQADSLIVALNKETKCIQK